jgi:polysaccharide biosynthesis/export protein
VRKGRKLPIDFYRLLREGDQKQNIRLHTGDTIFVPDNTNEVVFVFGGNTKGTSVPLINGRLNLIQALAAAGFNYTDHSMGQYENVRVIRSEGDRGQFITINAEKILRGKAAPFMLIAGDIVYVPETAWTKWNQILNQLLPSLQVIANLLNPFVQIKFLGGL